MKSAEKVERAVMQAVFLHAISGVHEDLVAASEGGALPNRFSVRSLSPNANSFVVDVRSGLTDRVLVRMSSNIPGNRESDGVNAHQRVRPETVELVTTTEVVCCSMGDVVSTLAVF